MINRTIKQVSKMIKAENDLSRFSEIRIEGVCIDSRKVQPGNLYIPLKGRFSDGHQYVEAAINAGASAALWQIDVPNPPEGMPIIMVEDALAALQQLAKSYRDELSIKVVGVTGSNGKTTTKDMVASVLKEKYKVQKTEGNFNNHQGLPLTILSLEEDTQVAVLEMGMSARGEIEFLTKLACPDIAIITNIGEAHLQDLGSREAIAEAKFEIIQGLSEKGLLVYLGDEPLLNQLLRSAQNFRVKTFGKNESNDLYPVSIRQEGHGSIYRVNGIEGNFHIPVLGEYNVLNSLAAIHTALELDLSLEQIQKGLNSMKLTAMRMEMIDGYKGSKIINDAYNASPTSTKAAIRMMEGLDGEKNKILVLGDMLELGEDEKDYHKQVGREIDPEKINYIFTFGELARHITEEARHLFPEGHAEAFMDKGELVKKLKSIVKEDDYILIKASRGMKLEEVVNSILADQKQ
ncbi:UDP-N-acetylmuramoyl-tripeptide--D-alanyl-D-alanine ligase [Heyndrickxia acidicola]|uniref:UDP-N-acetylmuramoyl-tripeptide--D-alanyl-D-alanine ligase n=1 Tax=Heyndrickxia acidicola TaxID=209389 RepID=A0ABU6ME73_9BACI|nr:UDP-N-acetylmuramoyl-tripeptide--D-alanyl-D-alanine ligase [Heyndrickxia acidicola]MED1202962.1 UDP-N-acetylmuramoyl-tripeptide--D-alanyl-D-alanine ligase [Heyndrickxia acidicola]